ncbi:MAG: DNA polymerase IV [Vicinamibacteria bacterium]|nr:DNA polymerase IV [Vicinamibacteria bacterium]
MDAFYAAVEERDRPELRGKPVIIGADPKGGAGRGVVSTANYEARKFGVGSAMPISTAFRLCPQGVFISPDMSKYSAISLEIRAIFEAFTDLVEPLSVDEAFLDVTASVRLFGNGEGIARAIKARIKAETRLTASVGVASAKLIAKIASDLRKPDGLVVVPPGTERAFLAPLPVRRLWGIGPKMEERLAKLGIHTVGQLADAKVTRLLGTHGLDLQRLARGEDDRPVVSDSGPAKSVSVEHTFDVDEGNPRALRKALLRLADELSRRLRAESLAGRTVTLKYRDETFRTTTHARSGRAPTNVASELFETASGLFDDVHGSLKVRLLGIGVSGFTEPVQRGLFEEESPRRGARIDELRDRVREKFGREALVRASDLEDEKGQEGRRDPEGHPLQARLGNPRKAR